MRIRLLLLCISILFLASCKSVSDSYSVPEVSEEKLAHMPEWAKDAIWYQIMVERFRDGDPTNQPSLRTIEGSWPHDKPSTWQPSVWTSDWYALADWELDSGKPFYETVHMRRYGGDLQGVIDKLDYLSDLGITAIYFNPLNNSPSMHKYDPSYYHHIDVNFGPDPDGDLALIATEDPANPDTWVWTSADKLFLELIQEARQREIRIIMDFSWNHTGSEFWAWQDVLQNQLDSPFRYWYEIESFDDPEAGTSFSYSGWAGVPELPEFKKIGAGDWVHGQPVPGDLHPEVKEHIFAVTRRWLDPHGNGDLSAGVDGFRLDVAELIPMGFWRDYRAFVRSINPEAYMVAELWWDDWPDVLLDPSPWLDANVFDAAMNYRWFVPTRSWFAGTEIPIRYPSEVVAYIDSVHQYNPTTWQGLMNTAATHDTPRNLTSLFNKTQYKYRALPAQNPDYKIHKPDEKTYQDLKQLLLFQFTFKGAPHIWMGEELGMWAADDPDTRKPLWWPDLEFEDEVSHPLGKERPRDTVAMNEEIFSYYQSLISIRREFRSLSRGDLDFFLIDDDRQLLGFSRSYENEKVYVLFNNSDTEQQITFDEEFGTLIQLIGAEPSYSESENSVSITVAANSGALYWSNH